MSHGQRSGAHAHTHTPVCTRPSFRVYVQVDNLPGFHLDRATLCAHTMADDQLLQVTHDEVRLVRDGGRALAGAWSPAAHPNTAGRRITLAAASATEVLLALSGGVLAYLVLDASSASGWQVAACTTLPHEISCVAINTLSAGPAASSGGAASGMIVDEPAALKVNLAAVGLWTDVSLRLFVLPTLTQVAQEMLGGEIQSRYADPAGHTVAAHSLRVRAFSRGRATPPRRACHHASRLICPLAHCPAAPWRCNRWKACRTCLHPWVMAMCSISRSTLPLRLRTAHTVLQRQRLPPPRTCCWIARACCSARNPSRCLCLRTRYGSLLA
ncbi:hypothetical protein EON66_01765 [archaeon]|nr:MAG: hypothetical protein EON66_01765 [archaeon]